MSLYGSLADIVVELDHAGIDHMVAGSLASTHHAEPRSTQDIDLVIDPTHESLDIFVSALDRNRYYVGDSRDAFADRGTFNVIDTASGWKIDLIIRRDRPFSISEFARRLQVEMGGVSVFVATAEDTILAKLEWAAEGGSDRQLRDAAAIVAAVGNGLDLKYLRHWADVLRVSDALCAILP